MQGNAIFKQQFTLKIFITEKMAYSCCLSQGVNQHFRDSTSVTRYQNKTLSTFSESCPKSSHFCFYFNLLFFTPSQTFPKIQCYFCKKICCQCLLEISQSGHTGFYPIKLYKPVQETNLVRIGFVVGLIRLGRVVVHLVAGVVVVSEVAQLLGL